MVFTLAGEIVAPARFLSTQSDSESLEEGALKYETTFTCII